MKKQRGYSLCPYFMAVWALCLFLYFPPAVAHAETFGKEPMATELDKRLLNNMPTVVEKALQDGANPNAITDDRGITIFAHLLARGLFSDERGKALLSSFLKKGADINGKDAGGMPLIELLFLSDNFFDILDALLDAGVKIDMSSAKDPYFSVVFAVATDAPFGEIQTYLQKGATFNVEFGERTLFTYAIQKNRLDMVREYLRTGGYVDYVPIRGYKTPLMYAAIYNSDTLIMQELLQHGADVHARDKLTGTTALGYARKRGDKTTGERLLRSYMDVHGKSGSNYYLFWGRECRSIHTEFCELFHTLSK